MYYVKSLLSSLDSATIQTQTVEKKNGMVEQISRWRIIDPVGTKTCQQIVVRRPSLLSDSADVSMTLVLYRDDDTRKRWRLELNFLVNPVVRLVAFNTQISMYSIQILSNTSSSNSSNSNSDRNSYVLKK
mmetsp:Transcript_13352/g.14886  ORF Transcript_13352/g.14886 Transcript_13352/m.14886 type:complete len:130 (-) Transcript_13352:283-672(-)